MRLPDPNVRTPLSSERQWRTALGSSLRVEHDYRPRVEGALPAGLEGRLYRNGPGLFERNGAIIADFVGYDTPDHFIGRAPAFAAVMRGEDGEAEFPGTIRRYVIDLKTKALRQEIIDAGNHEFPMINLRVGLQEHRYGYFACGRAGDWILDGVARVDMDSGAREEFRFGPRHFVGEPIFAPRGSSEGDGWILTQVQSGETGKSFLAVFDAGNLGAGPVAKVHLRHHVPLSFHGYWDAGA